jgi:hypothetical protein
LWNGADAGGLQIEAGDIFVATVGEHFTVNFLRSSHRVVAIRARRFGAMAAPVEIDADFVMIS